MVVLHMSFDPPSCFEMEGRFDLARTTPNMTRCDRRALLQPRATVQVLAGGAIAHGAIPGRTCPDKSAPQEGD